VHVLFLDESGQLAEKKFFALGGGYLKTLLPRFACHPATGELDGVGIKRFPEQVRRPREETRLFEPPAV
jgi:hypothetical protein